MYATRADMYGRRADMYAGRADMYGNRADMHARRADTYETRADMAARGPDSYGAAPGMHRNAAHPHCPLAKAPPTNILPPRAQAGAHAAFLSSLPSAVADH